MSRINRMENKNWTTADFAEAGRLMGKIDGKQWALDNGYIKPNRAKRHAGQIAKLQRLLRDLNNKLGPAGLVETQKGTTWPHLKH